MAKRVAIPFKRVAVRVVGPRAEYLAARVQRLDMPANIPTTDIDELGDPQHAGTVRDVAEVTATIQAYDVSVKLFAALTGKNPNSYPGAGVDVSLLGDVDIIGVIRDETVADYAKSVHLRRCRVNGFTFTYSINGEATEEYTFQGSEKRWFKYDIIVDAFTSSNSSPLTLSYTPLTLKNNHKVISYVQDGTYYKEVTSSPTAGAGEYRYNTSGHTITTPDSIVNYAVAVYHTNTGSNLWNDVSDSSIPAAVRGKDIPVLIAANQIDRVQSVTIRGTFPVERVEEMGNSEVAGYITQVPQITGDITVLDTDISLISLFTTGSLTSSDVEYQLCEYTADGISLEIRIQDPSDACTLPGSGTTIKTIYIPSLTITSEGHSTNVGGSAQQTFSFRSTTGQCIVYSGSR
jgi:hypothetical protein